MRLETAFLAQAAEVLADGRIFIHGGGIEGFVVPGTPIVIPTIAFVLRLHFVREECGAEHHLRVTVTDPNGVDCGLNALTRMAPQIPSDSGDKGARLFVVINVINLTFAFIGTYAVNLFVNENPLDTFSIGIALAPQPVNEGQ